MLYLSGNCLSSLFVPLFMLGIFWLFEYKRVRKLLLFGAVTCLAITGVTIYYIVGNFQSVEPVVAMSEDGVLLTNGTLEPLSGDDTTLYNYTIEVHLPSFNSTVNQSNLLLVGLLFVSESSENATMHLLSRDDATLTEVYYYTTTREFPINYYVFEFIIDGNLTVAGYVDDDGQINWIEGPISDDAAGMAVFLIPRGLISVYVYNTFAIYAIMCGMIWWVRRARRMRINAVERLEAERAKMKAEQPKEESAKVAKTPSLATAMGLEKEETFVCSECGADVPADATVCPKCGERFD
jgi:ribosomal protein L40E